MSEENLCKHCGEQVQSGSLRCWNCLSYLRDDIALAAMEKLSTPRTVILSEPELEEDTFALEGSIDSLAITPDETSENDTTDSKGTVVDHTQQLSEEFEETIPLDRDEPAEPTSKTESSPDEMNAPDEMTEKTDISDQPNAESNQQNASDDEHHSIATGGDELLAAALEEEEEGNNPRKGASSSKRKPKTKQGLIVYCPNGHPIEVQERHRGKVGKCPKCREPFNVPAALATPEKVDTATIDKPAEEKMTVDDDGTLWMEDVHFHQIDLQKLSLKPGSLLKQFNPIDLRIDQEGILFLTLTKGAGLFGSAEKKRPGIREEVIQQLSKGVPVDSCGAVEHFLMESPKELSIVQPAIPGQESLFAGIPIFGEYRIAIIVPLNETGTMRSYLSFSLSQFRQLSQIFSKLWDIEEYGKENDIPTEDLTMEKTCHYTDAKFEALENIEWYQNDSGFQLEISGRECIECGLEISEDGRKKESIGGKTGKGLAKTKCPKCTKKFGDLTLYCLK